MNRLTRLAALPLLVSLAHSGPCFAEARPDSTAAQALFEQGKKLMAQGHAADACPKFEESQRLDPGSGTLLNLARCYEQLGRISSAWNTYLESASAASQSGNKQREKEARKRADALRPRLSNLVVNVSPEAQAIPGLEVSRDGEPMGKAQWGVPIPADIGDHNVSATAPGHVEWRTVTGVRGEGTSLTVIVPALTKEVAPAPEPVVAPAPAATPAPEEAPKHGLGTQRTLALVSGGVGVVGLGIGTVFALRSMSKHDEAEKYCNGSDCTDQRGVDAGNSAHSAGNAATVGMVIGVLGLAGGVALWFTAPRAEQGPEGVQARLRVGPGAIGLDGVW